MDSERVLVIGGTGLVGNALLRVWERRGATVVAATYHCHPSKAFRQLDMQDAAACEALVGEVRPRLVAVPAANPHVDFIEQNPAETRKVNVEGTLNMARAARKAGAPIVFFSSDYVFDGRQGRYREDDRPCPINEYGRQKAETEAAVLDCDPRSLVIRTSGAYGWQWEPKNFVLQLRAKLSRGQRVRVDREIRYNPTAAENLAEIVVALAQARQSGIFHVVGGDTVPRLEFAREAARVFGLDASLIEGVAPSEFKAPAPRPAASTLLTDKARAALGATLWGIKEGLERMAASESEWDEYARRLPLPGA